MKSVRFLAVVALVASCGMSMAQSTGATRSMPMGAAPAQQAPDVRGAPAASPPHHLVGIGRDYRVGPNDLLDVEVMDLDNLKRTVRVNAAGAISLPLIGPVNVAGLTSQELEARIADRYREKYLQNPQVSVFIKEFTTERITVEGAVVRPGIFPLTGQITLLRALALAGGFGPIANSSEVMLFRTNEKREREVAVYDVDKIRAGRSDDPVIKGDDLIVVQRDGARAVLRDSIFRDVLDSINPFSVFSR
ncbi:polysaccharide biosynthesis/export family protein [Ramlibacter sp. PS4R-6]|uniref:polysaccharide biosynthesis/export family protein n=1 Tax=Ramlibacter sp. PS4R-6 TaxID=3133438 RepID=UPI0030B055F8